MNLLHHLGIRQNTMGMVEADEKFERLGTTSFDGIRWIGTEANR